MNPGKLDRRLTIETPTVTRGAAGSAIETFTTAATVWAELVDMSGREFRASGALRAETTIVFRIRYFDGLTTQYRLGYEGQKYDILQITEEGRTVSQLVQAQRVEGAPT